MKAFLKEFCKNLKNLLNFIDTLLKIWYYKNVLSKIGIDLGGIAQLARAPALQAGGHRFESDYLHQIWDCLSIPTLYGRLAQLVRASA